MSCVCSQEAEWSDRGALKLLFFSEKLRCSKINNKEGTLYLFVCFLLIYYILTKIFPSSSVPPLPFSPNPHSSIFLQKRTGLPGISQTWHNKLGMHLFVQYYEIDFTANNLLDNLIKYPLQITSRLF